MSAEGEPAPEEKGEESPEEPRRRAKERVAMPVPVEFRGRRTRGRGVIRNISESGALVEEADPLVVSGGRIRLRFAFFEDSLPVELPATVVRETPSGFAVQFAGLDARLRSVLALVIARIRSRADEREEIRRPKR
jgi:hypothetical protein